MAGSNVPPNSPQETVQRGAGVLRRLSLGAAFARVSLRFLSPRFGHDPHPVDLSFLVFSLSLIAHSLIFVITETPFACPRDTFPHITGANLD
jgi:hypothetical protein